MLSGGLIEVFYIVGHHWGGDGFPCFLDNQAFPAFLDSHLLGEHIHDDEHDDREEDWIVLYLVYLENDELLIKQAAVQVIVQDILLLSSLVERFEDGGEVIDVELDMLLVQNLRDALQGKLIVGVEGEFLYFQLFLLSLYLFQLALDAHEIVVFYHLRGEKHQFLLGILFFTFGGCSVIDDCLQLPLQALLSGEGFAIFCLCRG